MGDDLFVIEDRQYELTETGRRALPEAQDLLARGEAWLYGVLGHVDGLQHVVEDTDPEYTYFLQQHPIGNLWIHGTTLMQHCFQAWAESRGQLEDPSFATVRPYSMIFRWLEGNWVCVEVGEESSYASWFGWA